MKILIVDDDRDMVSLMSFIFADEGFQVETAGSAAEAVAKLSNFRYQVIILDYDLRDKTGLDVIRFMKENNINSKILMVSGFSRPEVKNQAYELGISKFVPKPFEIKELMHDVKKLSQSQYDVSRRHVNGGSHNNRIHS
ncbi:MAG TPA: response regulator [Ignavibacteria bacterium]|nr:response regulator [Ignavibacteria bacterium]